MPSRVFNKIIIIIKKDLLRKDEEGEVTGKEREEKNKAKIAGSKGSNRYIERSKKELEPESCHVLGCVLCFATACIVIT